MYAAMSRRPSHSIEQRTRTPLQIRGLAASTQNASPSSFRIRGIAEQAQESPSSHRVLDDDQVLTRINRKRRDKGQPEVPQGLQKVPRRARDQIDEANWRNGQSSHIRSSSSSTKK
jgi:hypothetical protein